ncbi:3-deoxy-manno-octulosonate cytidylyltransferase [uncultured Sphingomonas sp.]|uniref:3-deoxy-manno-octulosonate cytidylyltransferase n=1 Tax=uncultured Sphingomonas sp. TaxID=158754 RepID=UPI0035CA5CF9
MERDLLVVPARWGSTRLPGKPLLAVAGRTLLSRVVEVARRGAALAGGARLLVATDDERVAAHARALGVEVAVTSPAITTGSGRALAAVRAAAPHAERLVNLQGDAPFTPPATVAALLAAIRAGAGTEAEMEAGAVATPVVRLGWDELDALRAHKRAAPFSGTTCIVGPDRRALWFSKQVLPAIRDEEALRALGGPSPVHQHVGLYAYRVDALARFEAAPSSFHERLEGLEQLRFLELGMTIRAVPVAASIFPATGIDTPADVARAEALIATHGDPFDA